MWWGLWAQRREERGLDISQEASMAEVGEDIGKGCGLVSESVIRLWGACCEGTRRGGLPWQVYRSLLQWEHESDERWDGCELGRYARFKGEWEQSPVDTWVDCKTAIGSVLPSVALIYCLQCVNFSILWTIAGGWRCWCIRRGRKWMVEMIWRRMEGEWLVLLLCLPSRCLPGMPAWPGAQTKAIDM